MESEVIFDVLRKVTKRSFSVGKELKSNIPPNPDYPYYPDLGQPPAIDQSRITKPSRINLNELSNHAVVCLDNYDEQKREFAGHPDSRFTMEIVDAKAGRFLRIFRTQMTESTYAQERQGLTGQGLFVSLEEFLKDQRSWKSADGIISTDVGKETVLEMPWFQEGEGKNGKIKPPNPEKAMVTPIKRIFLFQEKS